LTALVQRLYERVIGYIHNREECFNARVASEGRRSDARRPAAVSASVRGTRINTAAEVTARTATRMVLLRRSRLALRPSPDDDEDDAQVTDGGQIHAGAADGGSLPASGTAAVSGVVIAVL
jgi:hypothetical protein